MRHSSLLIISLLALSSGSMTVARTLPSKLNAPDSIIQNYSDSLSALLQRQSSTSTQSQPNPFLFRLMGPPPAVA